MINQGRTMRLHPYRCNRNGCRARGRFMPGTPTGAEKCPKCGHYSMAPETYRMKCRRLGGNDHPPRCDCNGGKTRKQDKYGDHGGVVLILGPHRRGQRGCRYHPDFGMTDYDLYQRDMQSPPRFNNWFAAPLTQQRKYQ